MPTFQQGSATLHYELDGSGPDAVYVPGMLSHSNDSLGRAARQALGQNYRLLTVDNRGSGQTVTAADDTSTISDMADDVAAVMQHVGMESARVLGISMGGMIALSLAVNHPAKVDRLVVAVASARTPQALDPDNLQEYMERITRETGMTTDYVQRNSAITLLGESVFRDARELVEGWINPPPEPISQPNSNYELQNKAVAGYDLRDSLAQIKIPTLVMSNTEDLIVQPRYQDEIAALISGAEIKRYMGGHVFMMLEPYAQPFYADVLSFWGA